MSAVTSRLRVLARLMHLLGIIFLSWVASSSSSSSSSWWRSTHVPVLDPYVVPV
jgi:hypothetical protein